jgi:1-acyl-sn-glycerol-3-phosphate acyltransferase
MSSEISPDYSEASRPDLYATSIRRTKKILNALWGFQVSGQENVPKEGAAILAFVHRSYLDPWIIGAATPRAVRGMAKKELQKPSYMGFGNIYLANRGIFFVDRENMSKATYDMSIDVLRHGEILAMAPEGTHKNKGRKVGPTEFGVGRIAMKAVAKGIQSPIIPAAMKTGNLWRLEPILVSIGKPVAFSEEVDTISQRREAAVHIDELVRAGLQRCYDQVLGWTEPDIEDCLNSSSGVRAE